MEIYNLKVIVDFKKKHSLARKKLDLWKIRIEDKNFENPSILSKHFKYSNLSDGLIVFKDNKDFRIIACINFLKQIILIKEILTHEEYNEIKLKEKYNCE